MKRTFIAACVLVLPAIAVAEERQSSIEYDSVSEALDSLKGNPDVKVSENAGWTIATLTENGNYVMWSFTPDTHAAHPTAVRREVFEKEDSIYIKMDALCQSNKAECDNLIEEFVLLNEKIRQSMQSQ